MNKLTFPEAHEIKLDDQFLFAKNGRISFKRYLSVIYIYFGIYGVVYLLIKTIITPLYNQLIQSRLHYINLALTRVRALGNQLSGNINPQSNETGTIGDIQDDTSLNPTETESTESTTTTTTTAAAAAAAIVEPKAYSPPSHVLKSPLVARLKNLSKAMTKLSAVGRNTEVNPTKFGLQELGGYLHQLQYFHHSTATLSDTVSNNNYQSGLGGVSSVNNNSNTPTVSEVKTEIRSVKGVLLSARNFPGLSR